MLKFRLIRGGQCNHPFFKIGIMDAKTKRNGKPFHIIGFYDPFKKYFKINILTFLFYFNKGVKPTYPVWLFLLKFNIL